MADGFSITPIPAHRDPRISPPWCECGDRKDPDFGHLWAEKALGDATSLWFDRARTQHCMTVFAPIAEGAVVEWENRDWIVTWGVQASGRRAAA